MFEYLGFLVNGNMYNLIAFDRRCLVLPTRNAAVGGRAIYWNGHNNNVRQHGWWLLFKHWWLLMLTVYHPRQNFIFTVRHVKSFIYTVSRTRRSKNTKLSQDSNLHAPYIDDYEYYVAATTVKISPKNVKAQFHREMPPRSRLNLYYIAMDYIL